jgi:hypothetical protein
LKFDDDRVTPALDREVFEENFGNNNSTRPTSAYALIYIRTSMMDQILAPVTESDIPPALSTFMSSSLYFRSTLTGLQERQIEEERLSEQPTDEQPLDALQDTHLTVKVCFRLRGLIRHLSVSLGD